MLTIIYYKSFTDNNENIESDNESGGGIVSH